MDGNLDQLRAQVYLALLNGQPPESLLPVEAHGQRDPTGARGEGNPTGAHRKGNPTDAHRKGNPADAHRKGNAADASDKDQQPGPAPGRPSASPPRRTPDLPGPSVRGSVNLVLPLSAWLGWSASPGEVAGFGPLDAADSRALAAALARDPATTWCVTVTGPDGRAAAHGCAKAGPGPPTSKPGGPDEGPGPPPPPVVRAWLASISLAWLETDACSHRRESPGYRPSPSLTHLIQVRQVTCTAPGCRRPATSCDFEHTIPYHLGGRSCECNGGPCCRRHHRAKQAEGWHLSQPRPGSFVWTTPHGRSYRTEPEPYLT